MKFSARSVNRRMAIHRLRLLCGDGVCFHCAQVISRHLSVSCPILEGNWSLRFLPVRCDWMNKLPETCTTEFSYQSRCQFSTFEVFDFGSSTALRSQYLRNFFLNVIPLY
uniref:Uncharacterized protein n=1 Tax=Spongospora subterranea TaxID=70186 RepID=A0A0H5R920_9EUKA|eukprot:CRZ04884.1 hypothetical protein [Spongospora subterranea]